MKRILLLALALLAVGSACGIPSDNSARQIADDKVPFNLLGPTTTAPSNSAPRGPEFRLYFFDGTTVRAVNRTVPNSDPKSVLTELAKGIIDTDPVGITTAIPKDAQILDATADGSTLVVTLNNAILNISGAEQKNAFGQLVYTATDLPFGAVRFRIPDATGAVQDVPTPTDNGAKAGPVARSDFLSLQG